MDIKTLEKFYNSDLGRAAATIISQEIQKIWQDLTDISDKEGNVMLGLGYCFPYMEWLLEQGFSRSFISVPNDEKKCWPEGSKNLGFTAETIRQPLPDQSVNCVIAAHIIEFYENLHDVLREIWRILTPEGRVIIIIPNKCGMWRCGNTPFSEGKSFSEMGFRQIMEDNMFEVMSTNKALFIPPINTSFVYKNHRIIEKTCGFLCNILGGAVIVEARKRVYSGTAVRADRERVELLRPAETG